MAGDAMTIPSAPPLSLLDVVSSDQGAGGHPCEFSPCLSQTHFLVEHVGKFKLTMFNYRSTKDSPELAAIAGS